MLDRLKELFEVDLERGVLIRKVRVANQVAGSIAGNIRPDGYSQVSVDGKKYLVHRIVWFMAYGEWPEFELDHIDGNPKNNSVSNLRPATHSENAQNKLAHNNKLGHPCVSWYARLGKYRVRLTIDYKSHTIGYYDSIEEAVAARDTAKAKMHKFNPTQRYAHG